jgi:[NiFe] hydrogenase assembly HybE family chaperone
LENSESIATVNPGNLLEKIYRKILLEQMLGLPILNADMEVEAVGFKPYCGLWLGVLITPWFMDLMLLSGTELCPTLDEGKKQSWTFPAGTLKFYGGNETELGSYQACSLISPMRQFTNQEEARTAAKTIMDGLFVEVVNAEPEPKKTQPNGPLAEMQATVSAPMSKRDFLRGSFLPGRQRDT